MTEVVFYILASNTAEQKQAFTCKLLQKIHTEQRRADLLLPNQATMHALDMAIWQYKPESFIPHVIAGEAPAPIQLYAHTLTQGCNDCLINLHSEFQPQFNRYQRVIEILDQTETLIELGRERFKQYRKLGITPTVHKIANAQ